MHVLEDHIASGRNKRKEPRPRTLKRGLIVFHDGYSAFDCTVRNLSSGGAMLLFGESVGVPNHFELAILPCDTLRPCTVRWRNENALGLSFDAIH
jgi:hypothetical protein